MPPIQSDGDLRIIVDMALDGHTVSAIAIATNRDEVFVHAMLRKAITYLRELAGDAITERQLEVAKALCTGATNKQIAQELGVEERTVKSYISVLMAKTGTKNRTQLAVAMQKRLGNAA